MRTTVALRYIAVSLITVMLAGCAIAPGAHMDYSGDGPDLSHLVDIEPITPALLAAQRQTMSRTAAIPPALRQAIEEYEYRVGPGDVLSIIVYDHPELTIPAGAERSAAEAGNRVNNDGFIFYPYIGRQHVAGKTTNEIRAQLTRGLSDYLTDPQIDVLIASFNSQKVFFSGAISSPGVLPITTTPLTIADAVSQLGGPTGNAFQHELILTRDGQQERLSLYALLSEGDQTQNRLLQDGDALHLSSSENTALAVMGQVRSPGTMAMGGDRLSLTDALARAGGINETTADPSGIFVMRQLPEGSEKIATVYQLDVSDATAFMLASQFRLEPSDVIYVTTAPLARWNRVISLLLPSIGLPRNITSATSDL
ncbi:MULTISPECIES: polysaccharide export protein [Halomonadaceae]|uniref:polysaccharide export protein n=1 Tax=Halomonadaceae TaxID=28256 RepID=UPI0015978457|nr:MULTISPECIES: polysaccharide export protein [Halomonas]QJQ93998.1 polysaccharide export protein Wza [Halomonas sp. PA5]